MIYQILEIIGYFIKDNFSQIKNMDLVNYH